VNAETLQLGQRPGRARWALPVGGVLKKLLVTLFEPAAPPVVGRPSQQLLGKPKGRAAHVIEPFDRVVRKGWVERVEEGTGGDGIVS
jgi:hypothetical protein